MRMIQRDLEDIRFFEAVTRLKTPGYGLKGLDDEPV